MPLSVESLEVLEGDFGFRVPYWWWSWALVAKYPPLGKTPNPPPEPVSGVGLLVRAVVLQRAVL